MHMGVNQGWPKLPKSLAHPPEHPEIKTTPFTQIDSPDIAPIQSYLKRRARTSAQDNCRCLESRPIQTCHQVNRHVFRPTVSQMRNNMGYVDLFLGASH